jgi:16S rRNA (cytosine1402-N4)-methyltransferase
VTHEVHIPVLLEETMAALAPRPGGLYCDATVGLGGHARAILERSGPDGRLLGLDRDGEALGAAREALAPFGGRVTLVQAPFAQIRQVLAEVGLGSPGHGACLDGCLADVGVSSPQLDRPDRGFSFRRSGPLDMRMDASTGETAAALLARLSEDEIAVMLRDLGEERHARRIAGAIGRARAQGPISTTAELAGLVAGAVPGRERHKDPATRTFQALRMAVNDEIGQLERFLAEAPGCLAPEGRMAVISFHSLEDRMVKRRFRELAEPSGRRERGAEGRSGWRLLGRRVVMASDSERAVNPRARSAKLRAIARTDADGERDGQGVDGVGRA